MNVEAVEAHDSDLVHFNHWWWNFGQKMCIFIHTDEFNIQMYRNIILHNHNNISIQEN